MQREKLGQACFAALWMTIATDIGWIKGCDWLLWVLVNEDFSFLLIFQKIPTESSAVALKCYKMAHVNYWQWWNKIEHCKGFPKRLWSFPPWRYLKAVWTQSWATGSRWPCLNRAVGQGDLRRSLLPSTTLWKWAMENRCVREERDLKRTNMIINRESGKLVMG